MHRFFLPPGIPIVDTVALPAAVAHQVRDVLRLRAGEQIVLLDNSGKEYLAQINEITGRVVSVSVTREEEPLAEPWVQIVLYQSLLKGDKFETVLQKGTEIGVAAFVPLWSQRVVPREKAGWWETKAPRWRRIIQEAAEQSGRSKLPLLHPPMALAEACSGAVGLNLIPWEEERHRDVRDALRSLLPKVKDATVNLFIGPEGGFPPQEIGYAQGHDVHPISLGPRTLRAETAALVATTMVLYELGELDAARTSSASHKKNVELLGG